VLTSCEPTAAAAEERRAAPCDRVQLRRFLRAQLPGHLCDASCAAQAAGVAIYSLCDPRELAAPRYVGQTRHPRRRLQQHLAAARLWLPDERPWWVRSPKLRPLYEWLRELFRDECRLPVMVVHAWVEPPAARAAERTQICECLERQLPLLNFEYELLQRQLQLI
jgi:hypothetical protein